MKYATGAALLLTTVVSGGRDTSGSLGSILDRWRAGCVSRQWGYNRGKVFLVPCLGCLWLCRASSSASLLTRPALLVLSSLHTVRVLGGRKHHEYIAIVTDIVALTASIVKVRSSKRGRIIPTTVLARLGTILTE